MKSNVIYILFCCAFFSCKSDEDITVPDPESHLAYFGFTIVDTYWDDPTDTEVKTNYADEIYTFSNLADMLAVGPNDNLENRLQVFATYKLKAVLHLHEVFFEHVDTNAPSGANFNLRADYVARWTEFKAANLSVLNQDNIAAFYIGEEPTWNGISFAELNSVATLLEDSFPNIPTMLIEAYPVLDELQVPDKIDWVGFDQYFVKNPKTDASYQAHWQVLKSKLSNPDQRIMVVLDSHYISWAHGDYGNIALEEMGAVATHYHQLALRDPKVIGMIGYFWPNGFDFPEAIGARGMPQEVKQEYERIGKAITGKN